ncbi:MAG: RimK family alpha-L-glutamate ligase [Salinisphaeraceae bacterium]|nr:RimK family alpha-L-glutamate ligase [Salinisphaeraceae bacterium]
MAEPIVVLESRLDWPAGEPPVPLVNADDYLTDQRYAERGYYVINLCRSYRYQSLGYYCSLLAEARGHRMLPGVASLQDLSRKSLYSIDLPEFSPPPRKTVAGSVVKLRAFFGQCADPDYAPLARRIFERLPVPALEIEVEDAGGQRLRVNSIRALGPKSLENDEREFLATCLPLHLARGWRQPRRTRRYRYDLAILADPADPQPPSNPRALKKFASAARRAGLDVEQVDARDYGRLAEFDALFIRETTRLNHHTYRFSRRAEKEGLVVMDDPRSILRCTNKVYLAELLQANGVATPRTCIFGEADTRRLIDLLGLPMVLKAPEGAFSKGVFKAESEAELKACAARLLKDSELALAQEFLPTDFDWRIGVLNRRPLYACQYLMAGGHWQIVKHGDDGKFQEGDSRTLPLEQVPSAVLKTAVRAANLIGDGLYGVDLKQRGKAVRVIEVNDNPSIDAGVEDAVLGDALYDTIMAEFIRRLELRGRQSIGRPGDR